MRYGIREIALDPVEYFTEPVSVYDVQMALRLSSDWESNYIFDILIPAARVYCEKLLNAALAPRTFEMVLDSFPCGELEIPLRPVLSVDSIKYFDAAGVEQTLDPSLYTVDTASFRARIACDNWPSTGNRIAAVTVQFYAGYSPDTLPSNFRQAMLLLIGHWFLNRETATVGAIAHEIDFAVSALLNLERSIPI